MLNEGSDNIMNYARWATNEEIMKRLKRVNLKDKNIESGTPLGYDEDSLIVDTGETHSLVIGSTGSGKTQSNILPGINLAIRAEESFLINDPKGEIYEKLANKLKIENYNVVVLDFEDARYGNNWNPLELAYNLYKEGKKDASQKIIEDLGYYLFYDYKEKGSDPFWLISTIDYTTGLILYLFENATYEAINLKSLINLSNNIMVKKNPEEFLEKLDKNSNIYLNLVGTLKAPQETRGSILAVFNQKIKKYLSREELSDMLSTTDFDFDNIGNQKIAIFLVSGQSSHSNNLIPLFVNQVVNAVDLYGKKERRLNIFLDEFDSLTPIKNFTKIMDYSRSIKIRFTVIIKSYAHLTTAYGKEDTELLKMCFGNIIYLLSNDIYTLQEISNYCGNKLENNQVVPLITIEELKTLNNFEAIVIIPRLMPIKTKLLPDYKIDWGYTVEKSSIPKRNKVNTEIYEII
jgi:type IV secretion system protein VirD4